MARPPSNLTSVDNRPQETVPKPNIKWESKTYSLEAIIKGFELPRVVQCSYQQQEDGTSSRTDVDFLQPMLLYEHRTCRKITAYNLNFDEKAGKLSETGDPMLIPEDYKGWFAIIGAKTRLKTTPHYTMAGQLASSDCHTFLIGGTEPVQAVQIIKKKAYPQTRDLYPGDVLRMGSVYEAKIKVKTRFLTQTRKEKFLVCTDQTDREVLVPLHAPGMFYILKHRSKQPIVPIKQICDIIPIMNERCVAKLIFGRIPNTACPFTGIMSLRNVHTESSVIFTSIVNLRSVLLEIPTDIPFYFRVALPTSQLLNHSGYQQALSLCTEKADTFLRNIKLCQGLHVHSGQRGQSSATDEQTQQQDSSNASSGETEQPRSEAEAKYPLGNTERCISTSGGYMKMELKIPSKVPNTSQPAGHSGASGVRPWELPKVIPDVPGADQSAPKLPPKVAAKRNNPSPPNTNNSQSTSELPTRNTSDNLTYLTPRPSSLIPTPLVKRFSNVPPVQPSFRLPPQPEVDPLHHPRRSEQSLPSPPPLYAKSSLPQLPPTPEEAPLRSSQKDLPLPAPPEVVDDLGSPPAPPPLPPQKSKPPQLDRIIGPGQSAPPMRPPSQLTTPSKSKPPEAIQFRAAQDMLKKRNLAPRKSIKMTVGNSCVLVPLEAEQPPGEGEEKCLTDKMNFWKKMDQVTKQLGASASPIIGRTPKRNDYLNYSERGRKQSQDVNTSNHEHLVYENFEFLNEVQYGGHTNPEDPDNIYANHDADPSSNCPRPGDGADVLAGSREAPDTQKYVYGTDDHIYECPDVHQAADPDIYEPPNFPVESSRLSGADSGIHVLGEDEHSEECGLVGMSVTDVFDYLKTVNVKRETRDLLKENNVDGRTLLSLDEDQLKASFPSIGLVDRSKINMLVSGFKIQQGKQN